MVRILIPVAFVLHLLILYTGRATGSYSTGLSGMVSLDDFLEEHEVYNSTDLKAYLNCTVAYVVDTGASITTGGVTTLDTSKTPQTVGMEIQPDSMYAIPAGTLTTPGYLVKISQTLEFNSNPLISVYIENLGTTMVYNAHVMFDLTEGLKVDYGTMTNDAYFVPGDPTSSNIYPGSGDDLFTLFDWDVGDLNAGVSKNMSFNAYVDSNRAPVENRVDDLLYYAELTYDNSNTATVQELGPLETSVCITRTVVVEKSILYQHGFTALSFFMGLILGVVLAVLACCLYFIIRRKKAISPTQAHQNKMMAERGKTIIMNENEAFRKGGHIINEYSAVGEGDSIVGVLALKDKMQMHRDIDSLDIVNTVNIDTGIEKERNDAAMNTTELLIQGLSSNKDISTGTESAAIANMRKRRQHMDRSHDEEYKREMKRLYKKISAKNRSMMSDLMEKQRNEKKQLISSTQDLPPQERNDVMKLMTEKHTAEQNAETYKLKLEQDEEAENLRKEFAVRTRIGLKEIQQQTLADVQTQGNLNKQQADWLLSEHQRSQRALESMYDEEVSRQRMILEEKLARRKAHAHTAETQEEDQSDLLNTMAGQQIVTIEKLKKQGSIGSVEAQQMVDQAKKEMMAIKEKMDKERERQEAELHKKLSVIKRKRLADLEKQHDAELKEYEKKAQAMQTDGPIDPVVYADGRLKLLSQQRVERSNLENEIDDEHMGELTALRNNISTQTETDLKAVEAHLRNRLPQNEHTEELIQKLMRQHEKELAALRNNQEKQRKEQQQHLQEQLARNRENWNQRKEAEKVEQEQLREYEDKVVSKLVNSQVFISEEERDKILKEHEKHMVKLENSLTLNKLRQKRMVEEKLALKRAQQMEKLQQKQYREVESRRRRMENNGEESDEESRQKKLDMMKQHIEQSMAVLQGRKLDWDTELEGIRIEMLKERSLALKEQEERLGAMVAGLQMAKAKELAKIEEQQKAIHHLKTNLIDDLNARGVLSDPETQAVIRRHQQDQEQLNQKLDQQRERQEQLLKQKLQQRLEMREKSMLQAQDEELKNLVAPNKTATKIKKMLLIHKHMVAMEKMRNQLEREIKQNLEQVKLEYGVLKQRAIQDQELEFIAGLVRVGAISGSELKTVLKLLYPNKSDAEFQEIFNKIFDPDLQPRKHPKDKRDDEEDVMNSTLVERVKMTQRQQSVTSRPSSRLSDRTLEGSFKKSSLKKKHLQQQQLYEEPYAQEYDGESQFNQSLRNRMHSPVTEEAYSYDPDLRSSQKGGSLRKKNRPQLYDEPPSSYSYDNEAHFNKMGRKIDNESDDEIVEAQLVGNDQYVARQPPSKLPPLQAQTKKKKKKKFLKKMAAHGDDELL